MLSLVSDVTSGAIQITPRHGDCATPIAELDGAIVDRDPATPGLQELKQWQALVSYLSRLPDADADGIPDLPAAYAAKQDRIVVK
jgi:5'-nucleotidase